MLHALHSDSTGSIGCGGQGAPLPYMELGRAGVAWHVNCVGYDPVTHDCQMLLFVTSGVYTRTAWVWGQTDLCPTLELQAVSSAPSLQHTMQQKKWHAKTTLMTWPSAAQSALRASSCDFAMRCQNRL